MQLAVLLECVSDLQPGEVSGNQGCRYTSGHSRHSADKDTHVDTKEMRTDRIEAECWYLEFVCECVLENQRS